MNERKGICVPYTEMVAGKAEALEVQVSSNVPGRRLAFKFFCFILNMLCCQGYLEHVG